MDTCAGIIPPVYRVKSKMLFNSGGKALKIYLSPLHAGQSSLYPDDAYAMVENYILVIACDDCWSYILVQKYRDQP